MNDRENDRKKIRWNPMFKDGLASSYGSCGPLWQSFREDIAIPDEVADPLLHSCYYGDCGSLISVLESLPSHSGPIFNNDNCTVYMHVEEDACRTSVESTIKSFSHRKDGHGDFQALSSNHVGDVKHRSISKKRINLLQNIKWNGRSHLLESRVSNHRQDHDDLM